MPVGKIYITLTRTAPFRRRHKMRCALFVWHSESADLPLTVCKSGWRRVEGKIKCVMCATKRWACAECEKLSDPPFPPERSTVGRVRQVNWGVLILRVVPYPHFDFDINWVSMCDAIQSIMHTLVFCTLESKWLYHSYLQNWTRR